MQGVERYQVRLLPHDPEWHKEFLLVKDQIQKIWGNHVLAVEHIGSTGIRGIYAKPILDVAVVVESFAKMDTEAIKQAGYDDCGPQGGDHGHSLFVLRGAGEISLRHIHCYEPGNENYRQCIGFRDYLSRHPEDARQYSMLKQKLAVRYPNDRAAYTQAKGDFIQSIYAKIE